MRSRDYLTSGVRDVPVLPVTHARNLLRLLSLYMLICRIDMTRTPSGMLDKLEFPHGIYDFAL